MKSYCWIRLILMIIWRIEELLLNQTNFHDHGTYGTLRFSTTFARIPQLSLFWANSIQFLRLTYIFLCFTVVLFWNLRYAAIALSKLSLISRLCFTPFLGPLWTLICILTITICFPCKKTRNEVRPTFNTGSSRWFVN